jgi:uncharacterized membrane protein
MRYLDYLYAFSRGGLGALFIYAGIRKLLEPEVFAVLIDAFGILPSEIVEALALILPALEVAAGLALLVDIQGSLAVVAGLLVLFVGFLAYALQMGLDVDCGCFGPQDLEARAFHGLGAALYRDLAMLTVVAGLYGLRRWRGIRPVRLMLLLRGVS